MGKFGPLAGSCRSRFTRNFPIGDNPGTTLFMGLGATQRTDPDYIVCFRPVAARGLPGTQMRGTWGDRRQWPNWLPRKRATRLIP